MNRRVPGRVLASMLACAVIALIGVGAFAAAPATPRVFPVNSHPYGKTYGEWTVAYWQWAMSIPYDSNPWANDDTGEFAGEGQSGQVWFLGGTLGNSAERTFDMPAGKGIFMPIQQWIFGATVFDCEPSVPDVECDVPTLQGAAADAADGTFVMEVSIDGNSVSNPFNYRAASPSGFSVTLPEGGVPEVAFGGVGAGTYAPQVADGYWLMLAPLSVGPHEILLHVESSTFGGIVYDIAYNITVTPGPPSE